MGNKVNLVVIFGGPSGEHQVSLNSAKGVLANLNKEKYNFIPIAINRQGKWLIGEKGQEYLEKNSEIKSIEEQINKDESQGNIILTAQDLRHLIEGEMPDQKIDLVLPIIHGPFGEDGKLQGMLEMLGWPYLFSGVLASALAMNKVKTKIIAKEAGINILPDIVLTKGQQIDCDLLIKELGLPVVVKPIELGSSVGISIAKTQEELKQSIDSAFKHTNAIMLEKYQKGRELTCGVIGNKELKALPVVEIIPQVSDFFDYKAKYRVGGSKEVCPAEIPDEIRDLVQQSAIKVFQAVGCADLARSDYIWDEANNQIYFLEINTIPGMTQTSLVPQEAKAEGWEFAEFLDQLINEALKKYQK